MLLSKIVLMYTRSAISLSHCLKLWLQAPSDGAESGQIIMGWANLGSLLEGSLKLFLSVWYETYKLDIDAMKKKDKFQNPDGLQLEPLRIFFKKKIWDTEIDSWVQHIQNRRNAIHAYKDKEIGSLEELQTYICKYLDILRYINFRLPYPDVIYEANEEAIMQVIRDSTKIAVQSGRGRYFTYPSHTTHHAGPQWAVHRRGANLNPVYHAYPWTFIRNCSGGAALSRE
jgi:hypothetical protein